VFYGVIITISLYVISVNYNWKLMDDTITLRDRLRMAGFVLTSSRLTQGPQVRKFEDHWSEWLGVKHSLFVTSGSTANSLLVSAWKDLNDIPDGAKVIVPACTWVTNIAPIIQNNLTPVFCDINLKDFSFDISSLQTIACDHKDIRGIFVTHLLGFPAQVDKFRKLFPYADVLEDVCESHGAVLSGGDKAGTFDVGGTFSFYFGHHMTTVEGGMVSTNNTELYDLMRMKRSHGLARESTHFDAYKKIYSDINPQFLFVTDGYNFRNNEIGAVLGQSQLRRLDSMIDRRNENYRSFFHLLLDYEHLFYLPTWNIRMSSFCFPLVSRRVETHNRLQELLEEYRIEYRPVVGGNLLKQPFLDGYTAHCPNADILHERGLYLGNSHFVTDYNIEVLEEVLEQL
jgi:CDP-4-dehydro-6-deoxyglucose reductase, E1